MISRTILAIALIAAGLTACAPAASVRPPAVAADAHRSQLDSVVQAFLAAEPAVPGAQVAVWRGGRPILSHGFGLADQEAGRAVDSLTVFRIASLTKQFTAVAVMRLAEQQKLSVDDPLARWVPEFPTGEQVVTLRHLLTHTSGIPSHDDAGLWRHQDQELSQQEVLDFTRDLPLLFAPGERYHYSNTGYFLLGMVIERASGRSYAEYIREQLAEPLRLASLSMCPETPQQAHARGYRPTEEGVAPARRESVAIHFSAGGLCANAEDLVRWSHHLHTGGVVISHASLLEMTTPPVVRSGTTRYGFGVGISEPAGVRKISHTGLVAGFVSALAYYPEHDVGIAVLFNSDGANPDRLASQLAQSVLGVEIPVVADLPTTAVVRARYIGRYDLGPIVLRVFEQHGQLWAQGSDQPENRLLFQGDHEFRLAANPSVRLVFETEGGRAARLILHQGGATLSAPRVD